jgi:hypothetical protein
VRGFALALCAIILKRRKESEIRSWPGVCGVDCTTLQASIGKTQICASVCELYCWKDSPLDSRTICEAANQCKCLVPYHS